VVSQRFGTNLPDLLNQHRVAHARALLEDSGQDHKTIEAVAQESGFNSRSAFYEAFRRHVGRTPSDHRRLSQSGAPR
jgi:AraC-like DNA-binding protein